MGWDWFYIGNRLQETQPSQIICKHPVLYSLSLYCYCHVCRFVDVVAVAGVIVDDVIGTLTVVVVTVIGMIVVVIAILADIVIVIALTVVVPGLLLLWMMI